jgi:AbrB family looped-hinge helix DNA binding protein
MIMKISKVTSGGRVTIPAELRKKYNLSPGTSVNLTAEEDGIKIRKALTKEAIKSNIGFLGTRGKLLKALMKEKKRDWKQRK